MLHKANESGQRLAVANRTQSMPQSNPLRSVQSINLGVHHAASDYSLGQDKSFDWSRLVACSVPFNMCVGAVSVQSSFLGSHLASLSEFPAK